MYSAFIEKPMGVEKQYDQDVTCWSVQYLWNKLLLYRLQYLQLNALQENKVRSTSVFMCVNINNNVINNVQAEDLELLLINYSE